jgi:phosphohistidine phosphatase
MGAPPGPQRRLVLLRHAKSSWDDPRLTDHERPLARRGQRAVLDLRRHLAESGVVPDLVLCSTARRAVETWEGVAGAWPVGRVTVRMTTDLYGASASELADVLRRLPDTVACALVVAHNPGLEDLSTALVGSGPIELRRRLGIRFPTGALATMTLPGRWADLDRGTARLVGFVVPRDLPD